MADAPKLLGTDTLRTAYPKVNQAIDNANEALRNSEEALNTSNQALANSENTQAQLDQIVIEGDSSVEAAQARVDAEGNVFTTLKERLDTKEIETNAKLAEQKDLQKFQRNAERPLFIPTYDGSGQAVHPSVLHFPNKWNGWEYWMAYTPYPNSNDDYENPSIAVSHDGIQWFTPTGLTNPIDSPTTEELANDYHMSDTHLVYVNGTLELWYRFNKNGITEQIMRKKSTDGINWSAREVVLVADPSTRLFLSPVVHYEDGKYKVWYVTQGNKIEYIESATGELGTWSSPVTVPISYREGEPSITPWHIDVFLDDDGKYYLILNGITTINGRTTRVLLLGESNNETSGFIDTHTFLLPTPYESQTNWDNNELYRSSMVKVGSMYRLYYSALSSRNTWAIGMLEGDSPRNVNKVDITKNPKGETINLRNIVFRLGDIIYLDEGLRSLLKNDRLKFVIPGVAGAGLLLVNPDTLRVISDSDDKPAVLELKGLLFKEGTLVPAVEGALYYNSSNKRIEYHNGSKWKPVQTIDMDNTVNRPTSGTYPGQMFFDYTLNKPIWRNKNNDGWVDANGNPV